MRFPRALDTILGDPTATIEEDDTTTPGKP
jgi:hypothetical protein